MEISYAQVMLQNYRTRNMCE